MPSSIIRVLGLDAAFSNCGMAVAEVDVAFAEAPIIRATRLHLVSTKADSAGKKVVRKNSDDLRRTREVASAIRDVILQEKIDLVCVEVPMGAQSARAAWALGIVVGILGSVQTPLIEVSPREVKLVTGDKLAEKEDMIKWASETYPALNWPRTTGPTPRIVAGKAEHLADALAAIHAGVGTEEFKRLAIFWRRQVAA